MADTAREDGMEDVLASIRRLVSEETDRVPETSAKAASPEAKPVHQMTPSPPPPTAGPVLGSGLRKSARAKLLLTDAFLVDEADRWKVPEPPDPDPVSAPVDEVQVSADAPADEAPVEDPAPEADHPVHDHHLHNPPRATTRTAAARGKAVYDDADQKQVVHEVESFLTRTRDEDRAQALDRDDLPPLDARARAKQDKVARRPALSEEASEASTMAALQNLFRSGQKTEAAENVPEVEPVSRVAETPEPAAPEIAQSPKPEPPVAEPPKNRIVSDLSDASAQPGAPKPAEPAGQTGEPMVPIAMIEQAVRASLQRYAEPVAPTASEPAGELVFDEEVLREMVAKIVKQELQGSLGERITRNVRKLVRREIYRALEARELG